MERTCNEFNHKIFQLERGQKMLNRTILMGRLTATPELRTTPNGVSTTSFSIAVERNFIDKATGNREADFINIVAWRGTAELITKYFEKGSMIAIEGSIQTRNYEDKNGNKRTAFEVVAEQVYFTGGKKDSNSPPNSSFTMPSDFDEVDDDADLPF